MAAEVKLVTMTKAVDIFAYGIVLMMLFKSELQWPQEATETTSSQSGARPSQTGATDAVMSAPNNSRHLTEVLAVRRCGDA